MDKKECQRDSRAEYTKLRRRILKENEIKVMICARCGRWSRSVHLHHIKELVYGGENATENLVPLCSECHNEWDIWDDGVIPLGQFLLIPRLRDIRKHFFGKMAMSSKSLQTYRAAMMSTRSWEWAKEYHGEGEEYGDEDEYYNEMYRQNMIFNAYPYSNLEEMFSLYGEMNTPVTLEDLSFAKTNEAFSDELIKRVDTWTNSQRKSSI